MKDNKLLKGARECVIQLLDIMEEERMDDKKQFMMLRLFCEDCLDGKLGEFSIDDNFETRS